MRLIDRCSRLSPAAPGALMKTLGMTVPRRMRLLALVAVVVAPACAGTSRSSPTSSPTSSPAWHAALPTSTDLTRGDASRMPAPTELSDSASTLVAAPDAGVPARPLGANFDLSGAHLDMALLANHAGMTQETPPPADSPSTENLGDVAQQMNNPVGPLWLLINQHDTVWWNGDAKRGSTPQHNFKVQPVMPVSLNDDWNLILRPVLPFVSLDTPDATSGRFERNDGFGDAALLAALSPADTGAETVWGVGVTQIFDTASRDELGQEQFGAGPAATYFHLGEKWVVGAVAQHWWGYSEPNDRDSLNLTDFQYVLRYRLTPTLQLGMSPNIQVNWQADGGDKYTVPIGLGFDWTTSIGKMPFRFGMEYHKYLHSSDEFGQDWGIRVFLIPVIANPFLGDD